MIIDVNGGALTRALSFAVRKNYIAYNSSILTIHRKEVIMNKNYNVMTNDVTKSTATMNQPSFEAGLAIGTAITTVIGLTIAGVKSYRAKKKAEKQEQDDLDLAMDLYNMAVEAIDNVCYDQPAKG